MDKEQIIGYIKQNKNAEIADLQKRFNITYKEAKTLVDELISMGDLVYAGGVRFNYTGNTGDGGELSGDEERRAYLEARRREAIAKMNIQTFLLDDDDDEEDDGDDGYGFTTDDGMPDYELRRTALELIIKSGTVSASFFQRTLPIGYIRACRLIDWMEEQGYITKSTGATPRKVLITAEEFERLYPRSSSEDDDEDCDFAEIDRLMQEISDMIGENGDGRDDLFKSGVQNLTDVLVAIKSKKNAPVSADTVPSHSLWPDEKEFGEAVMARMRRLIESDRKMGRRGAVKKAETYLEAVRDTHDGKMVQVYERIVYEFKNTSEYLYRQLKKQFFTD